MSNKKYTTNNYQGLKLIADTYQSMITNNGLKLNLDKYKNSQEYKILQDEIFKMMALIGSEVVIVDTNNVQDIYGNDFDLNSYADDTWYIHRIGTVNYDGTYKLSNNANLCAMLVNYDNSKTIYSTLDNILVYDDNDNTIPVLEKRKELTQCY